MITAQVSIEVAAMIRAVLDHYRDTRYHRGATDTGTAPVPATRRRTRRRRSSVDVDPVTGDPIRLTNAQRDAQALADWATATLDSGLGCERQGERPHLDLTATLTELASGVGTAVLARTGLPDHVASTTLHTARRHGCDAFVRLVLTDGQYRDPQTGCPVPDPAANLLTAGVGVLDYGRTQRIVPARLRRALAIRDRGCAFPGCHRPPAHTQAHHVQHWADAGRHLPGEHRPAVLAPPPLRPRRRLDHHRPGRDDATPNPGTGSSPDHDVGPEEGPAPRLNLATIDRIAATGGFVRASRLRSTSVGAARSTVR